MVDIAQKKYSWFRKHKERNKVGSTPTVSEENWTSKAPIKTSLNTEHECWNISVTSCLLCGLKMHQNYIYMYYMNYIHVLHVQTCFLYNWHCMKWCIKILILVNYSSMTSLIILQMFHHRILMQIYQFTAELKFALINKF